MLLLKYLRKSIEASNTLNDILKIENNNPNLYLAKSIVDIYNFNPREAEKNIQMASKLNNDENLEKKENQVIKQTLAEIGTFKNIWNYIS